MKKLMIAGLVAAMAGVVMAGDCGVDCAFAYRMKLAGKTVKGALGGYKAAASKCDVETPATCWAKPASYRLAGYIYGATTLDEDAECGCETCSCNAFDNFTWICWDENKVEQELALELKLLEVLRNGGLKNKAQVAFTLGGLNLAGFGVFNPASNTLKSANGFFAGVLDPAACTSGTCDITTAAANIYEPCLDADGKWVSKASEGAIAYGRWSLTYKADKVAAYEKTGSVDVFKPTGFVPAN